VSTHPIESPVNGFLSTGTQRSSPPRHFARHPDGREAFLEDPAGTPLIPNWSRVTSAIPDFQDRLREAIEADNA